MSIERKALQAAVVLAALVPVTAGGLGVVTGTARENAGFDSHFRYLSGLLLGVGLLFWSMVPAIERRTEMFRVLTFVVAVGGLARLYAYAQRGDPGTMRLALVMELLITPALCVWQTRVAGKTAR